MTIEADGEKELPGEEKGVANAALDAGQISLKHNELTFDADLNDVDGRELQSQGVLQLQQQQPQGAAAAICWERFLHVRSIKVLLVENDDSTRHVVTALLRNCNYEVIDAANGVQAWRILEDLNNHVDLVLTEVAMPCLSGIGLLCKIMSHKTRKNIPVIMMSSHDSMVLVFKCLSKGAVDFLVKPIRKNELKNLWQHVWRRCHSSSGSGSESGTQTQKSVSKSIEKSDNNSGSNNGEENGSNGLNNVDGSDDGSGPSGTQSSWTKHPVEVDSSRAASPSDQVAECPHSMCAQVIQPNAETSGNKRGHMTDEREGQEEEKPDHITGDKDLFPGTSQNLESQTENPIDVAAKLIGTEHKTLLEVASSSSSRRMTKGHANISGEFPSNMHEAVNMESSDPQVTGNEFEPARELTNELEIENDAIDDSKKSAVELGLKWLRNLKDKGKDIEDNLNVLRHSELSAFSRYNTSSNVHRTPKGISGSSYVIDNSLDVKTNSACNVQIHSSGNRACQSSKVVGNNNIGMGSTTNKFPVNPLFFTSESTSTINGLHPAFAFKLMKNDQRNTPEHATLKPIDMQSSSVLFPTTDLQQELHIQHSQHHQHHFHNFEPRQALYNHEKSSPKKLATDSPHYGSSNVLGGPEDGNPGNYTLNRSASGSNYGSNGQNGCSTALNARGTNGESDMVLDGSSGSGEANGSGCGNGVDQNKLTQREAALSKFRQKRKERCFKKKVRYQNRKRLAEQRPRVRGQFVRQTENSNDGADD